MVRLGRSSSAPVLGAVWLIWVALAGCASGDGSTGETSVVSEPSTSVGGDETATTTIATTTTSTAATAMATETTTTTSENATAAVDPASATTIATVPEAAAPGIDSQDPFCRAWSEFAGSFQALTFASIEGSDPLVGARLEVVAAGAVVAAAQSLDDAFPDEIAGDREVFVDDVIGPFTRRAARAVGELQAVGVGEDEIELLGAAWLAALVASDPSAPVIVVDVPEELDATVDSATAAFAADMPPIADDPSLITGAESPGTFGYIAEQCPDQGILAGDDAID